MNKQVKAVTIPMYPAHLKHIEEVPYDNVLTDLLHNQLWVITWSGHDKFHITFDVGYKVAINYHMCMILSRKVDFIDADIIETVYGGQKRCEDGTGFCIMKYGFAYIN